jgi:hypothetical protein
MVTATRDNLVDAWHQVYDTDPPSAVLDALGQS